jgi:hypothetical protein
VASLPFMRTTTTAVPDGGSLFLFFHIFVGHVSRPIVLLSLFQ